MSSRSSSGRPVSPYRRLATAMARIETRDGHGARDLADAFAACRAAKYNQRTYKWKDAPFPDYFPTLMIVIERWLKAGPRHPLSRALGEAIRLSGEAMLMSCFPGAPLEREMFGGVKVPSGPPAKIRPYKED